MVLEIGWRLVGVLVLLVLVWGLRGWWAAHGWGR